MRCVAATLFCAGAALLWEPSALAQQVTRLDQLPAAARAFDDGQSHESLPCTVHVVKPELNFGFRFQTGYDFETSLDPYLDRSHHWDIVFRVTPEDHAGAPVLFIDSLDEQPRSETGLIGEYSGAFQTGEGRYRVEWGLVDDLGRVCRHEWTIDAHLTFSERSEKVAMPPDTAGDLSLRSAESASGATKSRHVTILLNAGYWALYGPVIVPRSAPVVQQPREPAHSWGMLLSMLASVVEQMPEASVRVVVFDTGQQRELFRKDGFTLEDMKDVQRLANAKQHWTVDYHSLQDPAGGWHLLRDLENEEMNAPSPADTVVFLGAPPGNFDEMPPGMPGPKTGLRFFYLKYGPAPKLPMHVTPDNPHNPESHAPVINAPLPPPSPGDKPDLIEQSVRHLKGKVLLILSPADFGKALAVIRR